MKKSYGFVAAGVLVPDDPPRAVLGRRIDESDRLPAEDEVDAAAVLIVDHAAEPRVHPLRLVERREHALDLGNITVMPSWLKRPGP